MKKINLGIIYAGEHANRNIIPTILKIEKYKYSSPPPHHQQEDWVGPNI